MPKRKNRTRGKNWNLSPGEIAREETRALRAKYLALWDKVDEAITQSDPIDIVQYGDDYRLETDTIVPRLRECAGVPDVQRVLVEEFTAWFGSSGASGTGYDLLAERIWFHYREWVQDKLREERAGEEGPKS